MSSPFKINYDELNDVITVTIITNEENPTPIPVHIDSENSICFTGYEQCFGKKEAYLVKKETIVINGKGLLMYNTISYD